MRAWRGLLVATALLAASAAHDVATAGDAPRAVDAIESDLVADDPAVRAKAAAELTDRFPDGAVAVPMLVDLLDDESPEVVAAAAKSLDAFAVAGAPALTASGPARLGLSTPLQVSAPSEPGALWIVAASLSSNNPIFPGACLSDPIFFEPFTAPIGVLDGSGLSSGLALLVPGSPVALYQGIHVQSLIFGASSLLLTNDVSFTVQP